MSLWVGLGGATRDACVSLCTREEVLGVCAQERITRVRGAGFGPTGLPSEALDELLRRAARRLEDIEAYILAEDVPPLDRVDTIRLEHHLAHACAAFLPSPFDTATVVVCDHEAPQVSVWDGDGSKVVRNDWPWQGPGFAEIYSDSARALGFTGAGCEQRMEAIARLDPTRDADRVSKLFSFADDRLQLAANWQSRIESWSASADVAEKACLAAAIQSRIGELLIQLLGAVARRAPIRRRLCVGGSLFYNSHFNSLIKSAGLFEEAYVPISPGNAGLSVGGVLHASGASRRPVTPFLGPAYTPSDVKATLDNCKLTYEWASESDTVAIAVEALQRGHLVAWFDGSMEWGNRALGARSILANPLQQHTLENLNHFLKHRDPWRGYALSGMESAVREHFNGPSASPYMECDYAPKDPGLFRGILPGSRSSVRIHTVGAEGPSRFATLLRAFGDASGLPILVNTSFNGFREPIVCSPRDAVRVFYGTGIDTLIMGEFVIRK